jgi:hypothetical protein
MASSSSKTPHTIPLLIETSTGVTEYLLGMFTVDDKPVISPLTARVASGRGSNATAETLHQAIDLYRWAITHPEVLGEGLVSYDR